MKNLVKIHFVSHEKDYKVVDQFLIELGIYKFKRITIPPHHYYISLEKGDDRLNKIIDELKKQNIDKEPGKTEERVYSKKEIESAEFLHLNITAECGDGYNVYGTQFNISSVCLKCGSGEVQKTDLIVDKKQMGGKDIAETYNFEIIVSEGLANILKENNFSGYKLRPVHHYSEIKNEPVLHQLIPTNTLPPTVTPTKIEKSAGYCDKCNRNGLYFKSELYYSRKDLKEIYDFNNTWEYTKEKATRGTSSQEHIISQKAYQVLKQNKIRGIKVEPVAILNGGRK